MTSIKHQLFGSPSRDSQSLRNDRCQNILYKAVFEHFKENKTIAALLVTSKSFQNSSFGANFLVNFVVDKDSILLLESVLSPSSCFSLQFVPSLHIEQSWNRLEKIDRQIFNFVGELASTKYFHASLRSLKLCGVTDEILSFFFGSSSSAWPQLHELTLRRGLNPTVLEIVSANAVQLRTVNFSASSGVDNACLESLSKLSNITSLDLSYCIGITDAGLEHLSHLSGITSLNVYNCWHITNACLEHLSKLSSMTSLNLGGCDQVTDDAAQTALPNCQIQWS